MKNINKLKLITIGLMILLVICYAKTSFAAATQITSISTSSGNSANNVVNNLPNGVNTVVNEPTNNVVNVATTNNSYNNYNNVVNNIPDTGAESYTAIMILIVLTSISTVYTYIKVKKYNL